MSTACTGYGFFRSDLGLGVAQYGAAVLALATVAGMSTAASVRLDDRDVAVVHRKPPGRPAQVGLWLLFAGLCYLLVVRLLISRVGTGFLRGAGGAFLAFGIWGACAIVAAGFALSAPRLLALVFGRLAGRAHQAGTLVGLRAHRDGGATSLKLGALVGVVVIVLLGMLAYMNVLNGGTARTWVAALRDHPRVPLVVTDFSGALTLSDVTAVTALNAAVQVHAVDDGPPVVFGDCADLDVLTGTASRGCSGDVQWIATDDDPGPLPTGRIALPGSDPIPVPAAEFVVHNERLPAEFDGAVLVPARQAASQPLEADTWTYYVLVPSASLDVTLARLSGLSPVVQFDLGALDRISPDDKPFPTHVQWLAIAAALSLVIGAAGIAVVTGAEARQRVAAMRLLALLGAPRGQVVRAHAVITGLPVLCIGGAAIVVGAVVVAALHAFDERASVPWSTFVALGYAVVLVSVCVPIATLRTRAGGS